MQDASVLLGMGWKIPDSSLVQDIVWSICLSSFHQENLNEIHEITNKYVISKWGG